MTTEESKMYVRRKRRSAEQDEGILRFQSRRVEGEFLRRERKEDCTSENKAAKRLVNLELDVAEALAELWRMAHEPSEQGILDVHLRWSCKRMRSTSLSRKDPIAPHKPKEEPEDAISSAKNRSSCISERDSMFSNREEIESIRMSKESSEESPTFPLPSLQLSHGAFLPRGNPTAKSAFRRVLPMTSLHIKSVKSEVEEVLLDGFDIRSQNASARKMSRSPVCPRGWKGAANPEVLSTKSVSDLAVFSKPKPAFGEKEKEARKLLRIEANGQSARQIRRKQVLCDKLMKKASSLAFENEGMKQKRESLMQKLIRLRGENYHLKQQLEREVSGNLGLVSAELPLTFSESASVPAFQVPGLPFARAPVHALTWAMAAAQAAAPDQAHAHHNKENPSGAVHTDFFVLQHKAAAMTLPIMPSSKESPILRNIEQSPSHGFNGVCSPASMRRLYKKELGCTKLECTESCIPLSDEGPCDPSSITTVTDLGLTDDVTEESACMPAKCPSSQLSSPTTGSSSQGCMNTMPESAAALNSTESFFEHSQSTQGAKCGYTFDNSKGGHCSCEHLQTNGLRGRNYIAIVAAAEARKRRKELTRQKFSRSRAHRLVILAGNTKRRNESVY